jgi:membrane associated rhomboid family serine protease
MEKREKKGINSGPKKDIRNIVSALLFIPGVLLVGIAFGVLFNKVLVASLFGLGIGFILAALFSSLRK